MASSSGKRWPRVVASFYLLSFLGFQIARHLGGVGLFQIGSWISVLLTLPLALMAMAMAWFTFQGRRWGWLLLVFLLSIRVVTLFHSLFQALTTEPYHHPDSFFPSDQRIGTLIIAFILVVFATLLLSLQGKAVRHSYGIGPQDQLFALGAGLIFYVLSSAFLPIFFGG